MEREITDNVLPSDDVNELEERRIDELNKAGVDEEEVLERANKNLNIWNSYFNENIVRGKDDMNFVMRDQWTAVERSEFSRLFKPAMTFNKLYDSTKKIVGEQRKNKPDLIVRSLTGKAKQDQISLRSDLLRSIAYRSQNDLIYQNAFKSALLLGFGAFRIGVDYESPRSFNKVIRYYNINDPTVCSWDPTAVLPHKGDGNNCSMRYVLTREEFFATYPYVLNPVSFTDPYMLLDFQWQTRDTITICDEYVKEWFPLKIILLSDGSVNTEDEWKERSKKFEDNREFVRDMEVGKIIGREIPTIKSERITQDYQIMHYRMIRNMIIDFSEFPSKQLPIPFVEGDSCYIEGRQYTKSFIHEARDAQKLLNYSRSELAAELKNRRREQWLATADNIIGNEQQWRNPETQAGALIAKPDPKTGAMPQKMPAWEISQGIFLTGQSSTQDLQEILGFSESEALQGRDISGKARRERKMEGSMSSYVFFDNLNQAIEQGGRVCNDLLSHIVGDEERHMVLTKKDGKNQSIIMNQRVGEDTIKNVLEKGEFDVEIDTGPSFAVQKDIALEFFQQTIANNPQVFNLIADLWASNLDIEQMDLVKDRLKTLVPPEILAKEDGKPIPPPKPNPQEIMMKMEMAEKQAEIKNKQDLNQIKQQELELKKEKMMLDKAQMMLNAQRMQDDTQLDVYNHQLDLKKAEVTHAHEGRRIDNDFTHKIASVLTDLHKHNNPNKESKSEKL